MSDLMNNQLILNSVIDRDNISLRGVAQNGNRQFLQYYIDHNQINDLLPIQVILNSIFDRLNTALCISTDTKLNEYSGKIILKDEYDNNVISVLSLNIILGNENYELTINASDIKLNGNGINTPNGFVTLNLYGYINNDLLDLAFDPLKLDQLLDLESVDSSLVQISIGVGNGQYKYITLEQLVDMCLPQLTII